MVIDARPKPCAGWLGEPVTHRLSRNSFRKRWKRLVRAEGLEPPQLSSLEPKSSASTSSATPALIASIPAAMPRAAAYSMRPFVRSKKMAAFDTASAASCRLDNHL